MKIRLAYKLFAVFFLIEIMMVAAVLTSRYFFAHNFKDYVQQLELEKMQNLLPVLRREYQKHQGWSRLSENPFAWSALLRQVNIVSNSAPPRFSPPPREKPFAVPPPAPPSGAGRGSSPFPAPAPGGPVGPGGPGGGPPPSLVLLDASRRPVFRGGGVPTSESLLAIKINDQIVGWLGRAAPGPMVDGPPAELLNKQTQQLLLLTVLVSVLTAIVAFLFSRHLLAPIRSLTRGTRELAEGNLALRLSGHRRDELGELAENFNRMAHALENHEKLRRQWLADIAHELRTPLAILRGEIEALLDGVREFGPENLSSLQAEVERLRKLVDDLHLLSVTEAEGLYVKLEPVNLPALLSEALQVWKPRFANHQLGLLTKLEIPDGQLISGDGVRLRQLFDNLLENVFRYVSRPGCLEISAFVAAGFLLLQFADSGPGVSPEDRSRLFDHLFRLENSRSRESGGSGLGLSICRRIVENHGGEIEALDSPAGGLMIVVRLPLGSVL